VLETCQVWVLGNRHNVRRVRTKMSPRTKRSEDPGSIQRPSSSMGGCASLKRRMDYWRASLRSAPDQRLLGGALPVPDLIRGPG